MGAARQKIIGLVLLIVPVGLLLASVLLTLIILCGPSRSADFLITYPDEPTLDAVAQAITGLWVPASIGPGGETIPGHVGDVHGLDGGGAWAMTEPFQWVVPTGATVVDGYGNTQPVLAAKPGWFRVFRWNADALTLAPYITLGGGTATTDPVTGSMTITAGPVTMTTPLPPDCPRTF